MDIMVGVREGQHVVNSDGKDVGTLKDFQAGEPEDEVMEDDLSLAGSGGVLVMAELSPDEAVRLSRTGWVRIHKGRFHHDRFLSLEGLDRVDDDKLWLKPGVDLK